MKMEFDEWYESSLGLEISAYDLAEMAWEAAKPEWHIIETVHDHSPENEYVLVCTKSKIVHEAYLSIYGKYVSSSGRTIDNVTHWMKMPLPPKDSAKQ